MALGDLSPDQTSYVDSVARATGLARTVVVAWVGTESGWGTNKAGHNYLNIGPGRTYPSTLQAAAAASALINASSNYIGIRAAIPAGGGAQIQAIGASPWGTSASLLNDVYQQLLARGAGGVTINPVGTQNIVPESPAPTPGTEPRIVIPGWDPGGRIANPLSGVVGDVVKAVGPILLGAGLSLVFTVAAFGLIAMGVFRLTGTSPKDVFKTVSGAAGAAGSVAKLAAV